MRKAIIGTAMTTARLVDCFEDGWAVGVGVVEGSGELEKIEVALRPPMRPPAPGFVWQTSKRVWKTNCSAG